MKIIKAGVLYFVVVFGTGFVLGTIRVLWVVPHSGTRIAELMETPIIFGVTILTARWVIQRCAIPHTPYKRLGVGFVALGLLLVSEFSLVLWFRGLTISECFASKDPVSGTVYYVMLVIFALMPLLVARHQD